MTGTAFIRMMREDIETHQNKAVLSNVVDVMSHVVDLHPGCEIDGQKNAEDCYKAIYEYATKHTQDCGKCAVVTPDKSIEIVTEYLGLGTPSESAPKTNGHISLTDFL